MANTTFPNIDFRFRRGTKEGYENSQYVEGSLNFTKDEEMMYVHKDGLAFRISDVVLDAGTENQIRAIELPKRKLYLASDTYRLMWFDRENLVWKYVNDTAKTAESAIIALKDANGNVINAYYYPKSEAEADYATLSNMIDALVDQVSGIVTFDTEICNTIADLPPVGKKGTIYLIPAANYYDDEDLPVEDPQDTHVELIYVFSDEYGGFYEVIGNTSIDISNYYTKAEIDDLLANLKTDILAVFSNYQTSINETINGFRTTLNSFISATNNKLGLVDQEINMINNSINGLGGRMTSAESAIVDLQNASTYISDSYVLSNQTDEGTT